MMDSRDNRPKPPNALLGVAIAGLLTAYGIASHRRERRHIALASRGATDDARGRTAKWPSQIPWRGWWDILLRANQAMSRRNLSLIAAGAAFYAFIAIPSALAALVSLYGMVFDPTEVGKQLQSLAGLLPDEALKLLSDQLRSLTSQSSKTLSASFVIGLAIALWSARSGASSMITALNVAYDEQERRGYIRFQVAALGLTLGGVLFAIVALCLIAVLPAVVGFLPFGDAGKTIAAIVRWPLLVIMLMAALAATYRVGPCRAEPRWRWVSWGAVAATVAWLVGSALFSIYVSHFASYDKSYGSLGAVVVLLMWLYLSAFVILLGAQLNAEVEHQTARDSTTGRPEPLGKRGAAMADSVGAAQS